MKVDNPAARVAAVLEDIKSTPPNNSAFEEWKRILGATGEVDLLGRLGELGLQIRQTKRAVEELAEDEDPERLLAHFPQLEKVAITDVLVIRSVTMEHFVKQVTGEMIYSVHMCALALRRNGLKEATYDNEALVELLDLVRLTVDEVSESDLPQDLKQLMVRKLREVEEALLSYRIAGFERVEYSLDALLGAGVRAASGQGSADAGRIGAWIHRLLGKFQTAASGTASIAKSAQEVSDAFKAISGG